MASLEPKIALQEDELLFRARLWRVVAPYVVGGAIVCTAALVYWMVYGRFVPIVFALAAANVVGAVLNYRKTYVAVSPRGIRVRSPFSTEKDFRWSEITDVVGSYARPEIRSGERFAWVHLNQLADPNGFASASIAFSGANSLFALRFAALSGNAKPNTG